MDEKSQQALPAINSVMTGLFGDDVATLLILSGIAIFVALTAAKQSTEYLTSPSARDRMALIFAAAKIVGAMVTLLGTAVLLTDPTLAVMFTVGTTIAIGVVYWFLYTAFKKDEKDGTLDKPDIRSRDEAAGSNAPSSGDAPAAGQR